MGELNHIIDTLDEASDGFAKIADKQQKKMFEEVLLLVKELDTDSVGKVKQSIANLKRLTQIKAKLSKLAKDDEWVEGIGKFLRYFTQIQGEQMQYFTKTFAENTLTERAKEKHQLMKQMAVQNTIDGLVGTGLQANVTDKLNDILLRAVTSGEKFADLQQELHDHLMGVDGGTGAFSRYASTYATTAMTQFAGQNNKLLTDDLGLEWFMYVGSNKETTREFCEQLTKKRYIHKSEIPAILQGRIDDYQCAIYPKTGLPYGMIEGTNEDNFQCNCGGWNCRHQLVPVAAAAVPASIRARIGDLSSINTTKNTEPETFKQAGVIFELRKRLKKSMDILDKVSKKEDFLEVKSDANNVLSTSLPNYDNVGFSETQNNLQHSIRIVNRAINKCVKMSSIQITEQRNAEQVADELGVLRLKEPTFSELIGTTNPNFSTSDYGYSNNCQRCVCTFEMQARGVSADALKSDSVSGNVSGDSIWGKINSAEDAFVNKATGKSPERTYIWNKSLNVCKSNFGKATSENGRYIMFISWKYNKGAHVVNVIKTTQNRTIYDPQTGLVHDFNYYHEACAKNQFALYVARIDDCELRVELTKIIMGADPSTPSIR